jgi:hypothetical protein
VFVAKLRKIIQMIVIVNFLFVADAGFWSLPAIGFAFLRGGRGYWINL